MAQSGGSKDIFKIVITALLTLLIGGLLAAYTTVSNALERLDNIKADRTEIQYITKTLDEIKVKQDRHTQLLLEHMNKTNR